MSDSPVSVVGAQYSFEVGGSFQVPISDPGTAPTDGPTVCIAINVLWQEILAGCALQVCMPASWTAVDEPTLDALVDKAHLLFLAVALADRCPERAVVSVSIAPGAATGTASVTFASPFGTTPTVLVSSADGTVIASWESVTTTGFVARITSNVLLPAGLTANVSYQAAV